MTDLRPLFFGSAPWYERLEEPGDPNESTAWYLAKEPVGHWYTNALNAGLHFANDHGLTAAYQKRFAGIDGTSLTPARALSERRGISDPLWEVANELIIARYLERVARCRFREHEPNGRDGHRGDWLFQTVRGRELFVEVKTVKESDVIPTGVFSRSPRTKAIRNLVKAAYAQLPENSEATLVVLVGDGETLRLPVGIEYGDLFQALFGQVQITFQVLPYDPSTVRFGPSFHDRLIHGTKHRTLGCAAGFYLPSFRFYAIHNPWSHDSVRMTPEDLPDCWQIATDREGHGYLVRGISVEEALERVL